MEIFRFFDIFILRNGHLYLQCVSGFYSRFLMKSLIIYEFSSFSETLRSLWVEARSLQVFCEVRNQSKNDPKKKHSKLKGKLNGKRGTRIEKLMGIQFKKKNKNVNLKF